MSLLGGLSLNPQKTLSGGAGLNMDAINNGETVDNGGVLPNATGGDIMYFNLGHWTSTPNRSLNAPVAASYVVVNPEAELTSERQLAVDTAQLAITDNGAGSNVSLSFPLAAPPQSSFAPTIDQHLANKAYVDLQVGGAGSLPAPGTAGNVMTSNGTNWVSSTPSSGVIRSFYTEKNATQSLGGSATNISFQTVINNLNSCISVISTTQFDIVNSGYYQIVFNGNYSYVGVMSPVGANCVLTINGTSLKRVDVDLTTSVTQTDIIPVCLYWEGNLNANDRIVFQGTGLNWIVGSAGNISAGFFVRQVASDLTANTLAQTLMLSAYGQSDYITTTLNTKYPNTRHIWYNKLAIASANSFWVNSGETIPAIEIAITTKSTMPQWPVYLSLFGGTFTAAQDLGCYMLPPPGTTKTYTRLFTQVVGSRTTAAGTYTSLWDNVTTNVLGSPTSVEAADGGAGTQWGITWGLVVGSGTTQIIENYDTITTGSFANINILTSPASSAYFSAIQIRGRY